MGISWLKRINYKKEEGNMELETYRKNGVLVVKPLEQRLDASAAVPFKEELLKLIDEGNGNILINLENVNFIDSSGLGAIISGLRKVGLKGDIKLCCLSDQVQSLLNLTRLDKILGSFSSEEEGLKYF